MCLTFGFPMKRNQRLNVKNADIPASNSCCLPSFRREVKPLPRAVPGSLARDRVAKDAATLAWGEEYKAASLAAFFSGSSAALGIYPDQNHYRRLITTFLLKKGPVNLYA
jgi:hypothetical protein